MNNIIIKFLLTQNTSMAQIIAEVILFSCFSLEDISHNFLYLILAFVELKVSEVNYFKWAHIGCL